MVRAAAGRRAGAVPGAGARRIFPGGEAFAVGQRIGGKPGGGGGNVIGDQVRHAEPLRAFRIVNDQRETRRALRRMAPDKRGRLILTRAVRILLRVTGEFFLHHAVIGKRRGLQHEDTVVRLRGDGVNSGNSKQASEQRFFHQRVSRRVGTLSVAHRAQTGCGLSLKGASGLVGSGKPDMVYCVNVSIFRQTRPRREKFIRDAVVIGCPPLCCYRRAVAGPGIPGQPERRLRAPGAKSLR